MQGIYTASKTRHASIWQELRTQGYPIISTWIDEAGVGETSDFTDLWLRCIHESSHCERVILYAEEGDILKGAFIETGSALASGIPVVTVGIVEQSFLNHPLVHRAHSITAALRLNLNGVTYG